MYYKVKLKMKNNKEEIKLLNIQLITSLIVIITVTISLILTYNQKLNLKNKKTIFNKKQTHNISYINRLTILITSIVFLLINYKLYQISKKEGEDLLVYNLQIIASILTTIASIIVFYVVTIEPAGDEISDIENPVI
jgi:NADH:ubiquinone oxidoreductase subunit 2 (subunit N)